LGRQPQGDPTLIGLWWLHSEGLLSLLLNKFVFFCPLRSKIPCSRHNFCFYFWNPLFRTRAKTSRSAINSISWFQEIAKTPHPSLLLKSRRPSTDDTTSLFFKNQKERKARTFSEKTKFAATKKGTGVTTPHKQVHNCVPILYPFLSSFTS